jgi:hypothetical protein
MRPAVKTFMLLASLADVITGCEQAARKAPASTSPSPIYLVGADRFPYQSFAKVIAYGLKGEPQPVMQGKRLTDNVDLQQKVLLTRSQTEDLLATIHDTSSFQSIHSGCFNPGIGFVFYDSLDAPVAHITICLACGNLNAQPVLPPGSEALSTAGELKLLRLYRELLPGNLIR